MGGWKVCVLPGDPDKIDRQECHTEYPAETGKESNRGEPHLSNHDAEQIARKIMCRVVPQKAMTM